MFIQTLRRAAPRRCQVGHLPVFHAITEDSAHAESEAFRGLRVRSAVIDHAQDKVTNHNSVRDNVAAPSELFRTDCSLARSPA